ncbi:UDP-galactopyranose mutase [Mycoplasmoides genitalium]
MMLFSSPSYVNINSFDILIVGAGISGIVLANILANHNKRVLIVEKRDHIGGNCYDKVDSKTQLLFHQYGPHIFHTNNQTVINFISPFFELNNYHHRVGLKLKNNLDLTLPFDFQQIYKLMGKDGRKLVSFFKENFSLNSHLSLAELQLIDNPLAQKLYQFLISNVYKPYSVKMWGLPFAMINENVINRVKIVLSEQSSYFPDAIIQGLPKSGYTNSFLKMLANPLIDVQLNCKDNLLVYQDEKLFFNNTLIEKPVVYCGLIDKLFNFCFDHLQYRSLAFSWKRFNQKKYQTYPVVNMPLAKSITRSVEYKQLTNQGSFKPQTIVSFETPGSYAINDPRFNEPYYPINNTLNDTLFKKYWKKASKLKNLHLLGRLATYQYIDMDKAILLSIKKAQQLLS